MKIIRLPITDFTEANPHFMDQLVFRIEWKDDGGPGWSLHFPCPDRGGDAEIDFDDGWIPAPLFDAMVGRPVGEEESGSWWAVQLPPGSFNG